MKAQLQPKDRALVVASCAGKVGFTSSAQAARSIRIMLRQRKFKPEPDHHLETYRCRFFPSWHIGNGATR